MQAMDAIKLCAIQSNTSLASIGRSLGKADNMVSNYITRNTDPSASRVAAMLGVCGYALVAVQRDAVPVDAIVITA